MSRSAAPDGSEETVVGYDRVAQKLFYRHPACPARAWGSKRSKRAPFHLEGTELLHLRILIDKSIVEAFANDRQVAVRRIYPSSPDSGQIKLFSEGGATRVHSLTGWEYLRRRIPLK